MYLATLKADSWISVGNFLYSSSYVISSFGLGYFYTLFESIFLEDFVLSTAKEIPNRNKYNNDFIYTYTFK